MTKMAVWHYDSYNLGRRSPYIGNLHILVNMLVQYEQKVSGRTWPSVVDAGFGLTSVLTIQTYWWKILILGVEGVSVILRQLMENLVLKSNLLLAILSILVMVIVQMEVVTLPLLKDAALHGENLDNCYPYALFITIWSILKKKCSYWCAISRKNNVSALIPS